MTRSLARLLLLAALPFAAAVPGWAEERPIVEIRPGKERAFTVAVQVFRDDLQPADSTRAGRLLEAIQNGLDFNGVLLPLAREAFLGPQITKDLASGRRYDCGDWTQSGANALVEGVIDGGGGEVEATYRVWDTARCVQLLRGRLTRPAPDLHRLGAALADDVVKAFTGTRGTADTEVAFISTRTGHREIFVMDADGRNVRAATNSGSIKAFPNWQPNGGGILYTTYLKDGFPDVFLTSRGRSEAGRLLRDVLPELPKYRGVFSPDGKDIALVASVDGAAELFRARKGRRPLRLTNNKDVIDVAPTWSPDASQIAFVSDRSGSPQIYVMDSDGKNQRRITYQSNYSATPAWSPDGRWIAYGVRTEEAQFDLYLIDPKGEVNVPLVVHRRNDQYPSWSPDGRKVIFSSDRRGHDDLYVIDVNSQRLQRLTEGQKDNTSPAWGPFPD